jgi:hypothetical protein
MRQQALSNRLLDGGAEEPYAAFRSMRLGDRHQGACWSWHRLLQAVLQRFPLVEGSGSPESSKRDIAMCTPFLRMLWASTSRVDRTNETLRHSSGPLRRISIHCRPSLASAQLPETANCLSAVMARPRSWTIPKIEVGQFRKFLFASGMRFWQGWTS